MEAHVSQQKGANNVKYNLSDLHRKVYVICMSRFFFCSFLSLRIIKGIELQCYDHSSSISCSLMVHWQNPSKPLLYWCTAISEAKISNRTCSSYKILHPATETNWSVVFKFHIMYIYIRKGRVTRVVQFHWFSVCLRITSYEQKM